MLSLRDFGKQLSTKFTTAFGSDARAGSDTPALDTSRWRLVSRGDRGLTVITRLTRAPFEIIAVWLSNWLASAYSLGIFDGSISVSDKEDSASSRAKNWAQLQDLWIFFKCTRRFNEDSELFPRPRAVAFACSPRVSYISSWSLRSTPAECCFMQKSWWEVCDLIDSWASSTEWKKLSLRSFKALVRAAL